MLDLASDGAVSPNGVCSRWQHKRGDNDDRSYSKDECGQHDEQCLQLSTLQMSEWILDRPTIQTLDAHDTGDSPVQAVFVVVPKCGGGRDHVGLKRLTRRDDVKVGPNTRRTLMPSATMGRLMEGFEAGRLPLGDEVRLDPRVSALMTSTDSGWRFPWIKVLAEFAK